MMKKTSCNSAGKYSLTLSGIAHEIRNPLALINCEMQLLASRYPALPANREWTQITENLDYILDLLHDLTEYQNAVHLNKELTEPGTLLTAIANSFIPTFAYLNIRFETEIRNDLPKVEMDTVKIRQILFNLLRNAQESIPHDHGLVRLSAAAGQKSLKITVSDNGCGLNSKEKSDIFKPFVTHKNGGTGLGLPIAMQIAKAHGGNITVKSTYGNGSSFSLHLPIPEKQSALPQNPPDLHRKEDTPHRVPAYGR